MDNTEIIEKLYSAFSHVEKPKKIIGCWAGCCMSTAEGDRLLRQDIRSSSHHLIKDLAADCLLTIGDEQAFEYYLPRMMELTIDNPEFINLPASFLRRISEAGISKWTKLQQKEVLRAIMPPIHHLFLENDLYLLDEWLVGFCYLPYDAQLLLEIFEKNKFSDLKKKFVKSHIKSMKKGRMEGPWWDDVPINNQKPVYDWLTNNDNIAFMMDLGYWDKDPRPFKKKN